MLLFRALTGATERDDVGFINGNPLDHRRDNLCRLKTPGGSGGLHGINDASRYRLSLPRTQVVLAMSNEPLFNSIRDELNAAPSDRNTAVLGGAFVEGLLKSLMRHALAPSKRVRDYIEKAQVSHLQTLALGVGLVPADLYTDLNLISKIRNSFAHTIEARTFDQEPIAGYVSNLVAPIRFGNLQGAPTFDANGEQAKTVRDLPRRMQFITAVVGAGTTLEHLLSEITPFKESSRFYVDNRQK